MGATVVVFVHGGLIQSVISDDPRIRVVVSDLDCEEYGDGEPWQGEHDVIPVNSDLSIIPEPEDLLVLKNEAVSHVWQLSGIWDDGEFEVIDEQDEAFVVVRDCSNDTDERRAWKVVD